MGAVGVFGRASGVPDIPISPNYPLDTGIRPASNTCSGEPGMITDGEVNAHLGNPGYNRGGGQELGQFGQRGGRVVRYADRGLHTSFYAPTLK